MTRADRQATSERDDPSSMLVERALKKEPEPWIEFRDKEEAKGWNRHDMCLADLLIVTKLLHCVLVELSAFVLEDSSASQQTSLSSRLPKSGLAWLGQEKKLVSMLHILRGKALFSMTQFFFKLSQQSRVQWQTKFFMEPVHWTVKWVEEKIKWITNTHTILE